MSTEVSINPTPEEAIRWILLSDPRVARLLGMRIFAILIPASPKMPFMGYSRTSIDRSGTLASGPSGSSVVSIELNIYADHYEEAREIAGAVRQKLDGYYGQAYNLNIGGIQLTSESDDYVALGGEQLASAYQVNMTLTVRWQEASL